MNLMARQAYDLSALIGVIQDGMGGQSTAFVPSYETFSTLLDKIGLTISLQTNFVDHLEMFDDVVLENGATVEEYINDLLSVETYDAEATPFGIESLDVKRAYHYRSSDKTIKLPLRESELRRAMQDVGALSRFTAHQLARIDDTFKVYKYEAKKQALGEMIVRRFTTNTAGEDYMFPANSEWSSTIVNAKTEKYDPTSHQRLSYINVEDGVDENDAPVYTHKVKNKATADEFILAVQSVVESMKFTKTGYNFFGLPRQAQPENLVLLIKEGTMPIMNVRSLASAFNKELLGLGIEVKVVDDFGTPDVDWDTGEEDVFNSIYAILTEKSAVKYIVTRNEMGVDNIGVSKTIVYTKHFGENIVTSDAVNMVVFADTGEI